MNNFETFVDNFRFHSRESKKLVMKALLSIGISVLVFGASANQMTRVEYIDQWKGTAQNNMSTYNIPASIILAQGILESGFGNSDLARKANNHFGIKCHTSWTGAKFYKDDDAKDECFRSYNHAMDSYRDHALFLTSGKRYEALFSIDVTDYKSWAHGLKKAGYATHPEYANKLIRVIEENELYQYDKIDASILPTIRPARGSHSSVETISISALKTSQVNRVNCLVVQTGQTLYRISKETGISLRQLYKYNDFGQGKEVLVEGEIVFLQPKRMKSSDKKQLTIQMESMTLRQISQKEGVRLKSLMRKNNIDDADALLPVKSKIKL